MQVDALAVDLRPRSMMEATDLGVRLVQSRAAAVWGSFTPVFLAVLAISLSTIEIAPWLPPFIIFWFKPWLDRSLLHVMSRAVFGEPTRFADLWRDQRTVWWGQWLSTFTLRRLSPWRSFTQAVHQLEGQRGSALRKRRGQLLRNKKGTALLMHAAFHHLEWAFLLSVLALGLWFQPSGKGNFLFDLLKDGDLVSTLTTTLAYGAIVLIVEPFYVAAGFAMYLNRRVELEAWDIEQEFRRAFA
jgi:hypothetical protein